MEINKLLGFLEILKEWIKIMSRNGRLMAIITSVYLIITSLFFFLNIFGRLMAITTSVYLIITSLFFFLNIFTTKQIIFDFMTKAMQLPSLDRQGLLFQQVVAGITKDVRTLLGVELAFVVGFFLVALFVLTATVLLTGVSYKDKRIFPEDLLVRMPQPSVRLLITTFHVSLLQVGFLYLGFIALVAPKIMVYEHKIVSKLIFWVLAVLVVYLYLYFAVVWVLALVVSLLEECSGIEALGKAGRLVKGKKLEGFVLNLLFNFLAYVFYHMLSKMIVVKRSELTRAISGFFLVSCICLMVVFEFQVYTVLYFECKKNHGEEIELQGSIEFSQIPSKSLDHDDLP